jgi:hypothetical protein
VPASICGHLIVVLAFTLLIVGAGTPSVRHDWLFPLDRAAFVQRLLDLSLGWSPEGLGQPNPYPMTYWVSLPLAAASLIVGPRVAIAVLIFAIGLAAVVVSCLIVVRLRLNGIVSPVFAALLLFNPWTYNEIVSGHLTQTLAYLGLAAVIAEIFERHPERLTLALAVAVSALQTQFFLTAIACCVTRLRDVAARWALGCGLVVFLPSLLGIALDRNALLAWPFTIAWENEQSVPLAKGALLQGYFTHYADAAFGGPLAVGTFVLTLLALTAVITIRRTRTTSLASIAVLTFIFCSGTVGPLSGIWRWSIVHVPEVGVFRELYDLIAVSVIAYIILAAHAIVRWPKLWPAILLTACCFAAAWLFVPPSTYWVWQQEVPERPQVSRSVARYALMPPFQPVSYDNRGDGADPMYVGTSDQNAPLNALLPQYPANVALARYAQSDDARALRAVGVGLVLCREGFDETPAARLFYRLRIHPKPCETRRIDPAPIMSYAPTYSQCIICRSPGAGDVFFGDVYGGTRAISQPRDFVRPEEGWIDARLEFASQPSLGQPFGGAYTEQSATALPLPRADYLMVSVSGRLESQGGRIITRDTHGYRWIPLSENDRAVRCLGKCAVAIASVRPPPQTNDVIHSDRSLTFTRPISFIALVRVQGKAGVLRFNESFDPSWFALDLRSLKMLKHMRIDATFNAWILPDDDGSSKVAIVEGTSLAQAIAVVPGLIVVIVLFARCVTRRMAISVARKARQ